MPPAFVRASAGSYINRQSMNASIDDMRSLRSREAAMYQSKASMKASDFFLQESLRESINESLKETAHYMHLPIFKRMHLPEDGSFADDFKTGYYIG